ncbi:Acyl-CoA synthetase OS=Streptomyces tendae OX=1932 GN=GUR47_11815 PE=4 SV=1 [Streptomyces tendae]
MVVGDGRPFVGALVTIDEEFLAPSVPGAREAGRVDGGVAAAGPGSARGDPGRDRRRDAAVSKAESVRKFRVLGAQFTEDSGHLTPSLKLKRNVVAKDYADEIEAIYAK